jgi:hypothetical protein
MAEIKGFTLFHDYSDVFSALPPEECKELISALFSYSATGKITKLPPQAEIAFIFIRRSIDIGKDRQAAKNERNREIANARWDMRTHANASKRTEKMPEPEPEPEPELSSPNGEEGAHAPEAASPSASDSKRKTRFVPPTVEEVTAYCQQRTNGVSPQSFVDFYTSKGWLVGKSPMKDWKACVRTWEEREKGGGTNARGQPTTQQDYGAFEADDSEEGWVEI